MTLPLAVLAVASIAAGWIGTPAWPWLQSQLTGAPVAAHGLGEGLGLMILSTVLVGAGIAAGGWIYARTPRVDDRAPDPLARRFPRVFAALAARLWIDEFYAATFGRLLRGSAALAAWLERWVWGGLVSLTGRVAETTGEVNRAIDEDGLNTGFDRASDGLRDAAQRYSRAQTGDVQGYLRAVVVGLAVLALLLVWGGVR
jgi:NADH-quinone oxidoreductase subunit L